MTLSLPPRPDFGAPIDQPPVPEVLRFLARRRSSSAVTLSEPGPSPEAVDVLLRLAARVPDHGKLAPWRFIVLETGPKARFAARLEALAQGRGDTTAASKLAKLKTPPLAIAVVSRHVEAAIPEWEQVLSAGAVATTLLYAAQALGFGANWITDWYAYDVEARAILGLSPEEKVAAYVLIGTAAGAPLERERPDAGSLVTHWEG